MLPKYIHSAPSPELFSSYSLNPSPFLKKFPMPYGKDFPNPSVESCILLFLLIPDHKYNNTDMDRQQIVPAWLHCLKFLSHKVLPLNLPIILVPHMILPDTVHIFPDLFSFLNTDSNNLLT